MDQESYSRAQAIHTKRAELALMERDVAVKKNDLAQLEAAHAAAKSRDTLKWAEASAEPGAPPAKSKK